MAHDNGGKGKKFGKDNKIGHRFQPGQSGNPGGRPKIAAWVRTLAQQYGQEAIEVLVDIMRNGEQEHCRITAAQVILDRGYGKPMQTLDVHTHNHATELSEDELERIIRGDGAIGSTGTAEPSPSTH